MNLEVVFKDFSFRYSKSNPWIISNLAVEIPRGTCCAVLGPTGAGKSTLLHAVSGILGKHHKAGESTGEIWIGDEHYKALPCEMLFPKVGLVMQDPYVQISGINNSVGEEIAFTLENLGHPREVIQEKVESALQILNLAHLASRQPSQLSGGEVQRVALATILVAEPQILLLDEPRNSLDCDSQKNLVHILRALRNRTTIIFTDYHIEFAIAVADTILVVDQGRKVFWGNRFSFLTQLDRFKSILPVDEWQEVMKHKKSRLPLQRFMKSLGVSGDTV